MARLMIWTKIRSCGQRLVCSCRQRSHKIPQHVRRFCFESKTTIFGTTSGRTRYPIQLLLVILQGYAVGQRELSKKSSQIVCTFELDRTVLLTSSCIPRLSPGGISRETLGRPEDTVESAIEVAARR